jgi:hypothetical protein
MPSMIVKKLIPALKKAMFTATAVVALMRCSEDEQIIAPVADVNTTNSSMASSSVASLTVTGANTAFSTLNDCKTCTYIVSAKEELIDGKILGFKPGNIICLNKGIEYGNLEFVNIEGTEEQPIIIATIGLNASPLADQQNSANDPY